MRTLTWRKLAGAALAFGFVAVAVPLATANPPVAPHPHAAKGNTIGGPNHKGAPANAANTNAVLATLHHAHSLLAAANHDYDGHRAKAAESISHAMHELGWHHHQGHSTALALAHNIAFGFGGAAKVHEPQAQSDAQLKQAGQLLVGLQGHVPNTHKAAAHVQHAINEINIALKIR